MAPQPPPRKRKIHIPGARDQDNEDHDTNNAVFTAVPMAVLREEQEHCSIEEHSNDAAKNGTKKEEEVSPAKKARFLPTTPQATNGATNYATIHHRANAPARTPATNPRNRITAIPTPGRDGSAMKSEQKQKEQEQFVLKEDTCIEAGYKFVGGSANSTSSSSKNDGAAGLLGEGGFSKVRQAVHRATGVSVAVKCMEKARLGADEPRVKTEVHALKTLGRHENIARLYQMVETPTRIFLVMELCAGGELFDFIVRSGKLSESTSRHIMVQLLRVLSFIHSRGFAHRDLKPENILLSSISGFEASSGAEESRKKALERTYSHFARHPTDIRIKLIDFGLAADCSASSSSSSGSAIGTSSGSSGIESLSTCCGSPAYAAPELISGSGRAYSGRKIDVWSSGIIAYACLAGKLPFQEDKLPALYQLILAGSYHVPVFLSTSARSFVASMLQVDPDRRASIASLLVHPFLLEPSSSSSSGSSAKKKNNGSNVGIKPPVNGADQENAICDPFPIKVNEENLDEEILWFLDQNKFFPSSNVSNVVCGGRNNLARIRRNVRTKFGYETASYWLVKDHGLHLKKDQDKDKNAGDTMNHNSNQNRTSLIVPSVPSNTNCASVHSSPIWNRYNPRPGVQNRTPASASVQRRAPVEVVQPSPAVHFLSVIPSSANRQKIHVPSSFVPCSASRRQSLSPGHALSPLNVNQASTATAGAVAAANQKQQLQFDVRKPAAKRSLFTPSKDKNRRTMYGSVERLLLPSSSFEDKNSTTNADRTPTKQEKKQAMKLAAAATTGKKNKERGKQKKDGEKKENNFFLGMIRTKLFFNH